MEATKTITQTTTNPADNNALNSLEKTELSEDAIVEDKASPDNSDYDSADSYSDEERNVKIRSRASDHEDNSDTGGSLTLEREEGDGQESVPSKKVDDDEDKKNPQYIPKRGTFYEHDDRTADDVESVEPAETEKDKEGKKKVWQDKKEKWTHDRFNDSEQAPKSRSELIAIYGYDIRNEEGPPRARRRRRYGRGPNKYTRNWEDEDAYNKPAPARPKKPVRPKKMNEEFPPLVRDKSSTPDRTPQQPQKTEHTGDVERTSHQNSSERTEPPMREHKTNQPPPITNDHINKNNTPEPTHYQNKNNTPEATNYQNKNNQQRAGSGRISKPKKEIKDSDYRGFTVKSRQQRNIKTDQQKVLPARSSGQSSNKEDVIHTQNFTNKNNVQELEKDMSKLNVDGNFKGAKHNNQRQGSVPPRLQSEPKGSKRYSSLRQRSLPEVSSPPVPNYQHAGYYPNDYNQQNTPSASQQQPLIHPNPPLHATKLPPPPMPSIAQVPVTAAPLLQAPFPQAFPQPPPAFLQPGVPPPPFIPQQTPQIINYVQGQPPFAPNFQGYQQQFSAVTPPTELYQPQGGITYYSTDQQVVQRPVPQKRPKAAIPIVAPPTNDRKEDAIQAPPVQDESESVRQEANESDDVHQ